MKNNYLKTKTTVSLINYHFVFCPRYRRKIFLNEKLEKRFKKIVTDVCDRQGIKVIALECDKDHVHMFLQACPQLSPSSIMAKIKGVSSRKLRSEFDYLLHTTSLWTRSFFVSTAGVVSSSTIKRYVEMQKKRG